MAERFAVNEDVVRSSRTRGANEKSGRFFSGFFRLFLMVGQEPRKGSRNLPKVTLWARVFHVGKY